MIMLSGLHKHRYSNEAVDITNKFTPKQMAQRFDWMAKKFDRFFNAGNTFVDFLKNNIQEDHCGTTACHGGWAYAALNKKYKDKVVHEALSLKNSVFEEGAMLLAQYLGFNSSLGYVHWAYANPQIWGNTEGGRMFGVAGDKSFNGVSARSISLKDIADWYRNVAERLRQVKEIKECNR